MTKQADIFTNPAAPDHIGDRTELTKGLEAYAKRPGSGVMSEAQWQAWMLRVDQNMRRINESNLAKNEARKAQS